MRLHVFMRQLCSRRRAKEEDGSLTAALEAQLAEDIRVLKVNHTRVLEMERLKLSTGHTRRIAVIEEVPLSALGCSRTIVARSDRAWSSLNALVQRYHSLHSRMHHSTAAC